MESAQEENVAPPTVLEEKSNTTPVIAEDGAWVSPVSDASFARIASNLSSKLATASPGSSSSPQPLRRWSSLVERMKRAPDHAQRARAGAWFRRRDAAVPVDLLSEQLHDGDVILFRALNIGARCQRCIANATYNHVALVVKMERTMVLEADMAEGVNMFPLDLWLTLRAREWCQLIA